MPTYDYKCAACGHGFEVFSKRATRAQARKCPQCGGRAERLISGGGGFLFKGEGFYATDYRSSEYRRKAADEAGGSKKDKAEKKDRAGETDPGSKKKKGTSEGS